MRRPRSLRPAAVAVSMACAALGAAAVAGTTAPAAGAATASAQSQYQAALKAATNQSVHFQTNVNEGNVTLQQSGDAGVSSGAESLTVHNGKVVEHMSAEVVGKTGYVKGNAAGLQNILGLSASLAHKYSNEWLSFPLSNSNLAQLAAGLLRSQVATELSFSGPFTLTPATTINGQHAIGIRGSVSTNNGSSVPEVLYIPSTGKPLPIEEATNPDAKGSASSIHGTVTFSNWGEHVSVNTPAHSVALSKLAPTSTSGATTTTGG